MNTRDELNAQLAALNAEWDAVTAKRREWMDAHMADFAKYPIGTELFSRHTGRSIGRVIGYYRYHADRDVRYDRSMTIDYQTDTGDNSSRHNSLVESAEERAARLRIEADILAARLRIEADILAAPVYRRPVV